MECSDSVLYWAVRFSLYETFYSSVVCFIIINSDIIIYPIFSDHFPHAIFSIFYLTMLVGICILLSLNKGLNFFYLLTAFVALHLSYGWGSLIGVFELLVKKIDIKFC